MLAIDRGVFCLNTKALDKLRRDAAAAPNGRARICLHENTQDPIQQMIVATVKGHKIGPLKQLTGQKFYLALEGRIALRFYQDNGFNDECVWLEPGQVFCTTFPASCWQSVEAMTDVAIYLETQQGPFDPENTEWMKIANVA